MPDLLPLCLARPRKRLSSRCDACPERQTAAKMMRGALVGERSSTPSQAGGARYVTDLSAMGQAGAV
jgi:hypothetical protein